MFIVYYPIFPCFRVQRYEYDVTSDLNRCYNVVKMLLCWRLNKKVATENKEKCENVWKLRKYSSKNRWKRRMPHNCCCLGNLRTVIQQVCKLRSHIG